MYVYVTYTFFGVKDISYIWRFSERGRNEVALFLLLCDSNCFSVFNRILLNEETAMTDASWCIQSRAASCEKFRSLVSPLNSVRACHRVFTATTKCTRVYK